MGDNIRRFLENDWTVRRMSFRRKVLRQLVDQKLPVSVPGSVYTALLDAGLIDDPYYRHNEHLTREIAYEDFGFEKDFFLTEKELAADFIYLNFDGLDTLCDIYINNKPVGSTKNMHRRYRFNVKDSLVAGENHLLLQFKSPLLYIEEMQSKDPLWGVSIAEPGFSHIRKAHYMFAWDWGPSLPDMGIFREVTLDILYHGIISDVHITQEHEKDYYMPGIVPKEHVKVNVTVSAMVPDGDEAYATVCISKPPKQLPQEEIDTRYDIYNSDHGEVNITMNGTDEEIFIGPVRLVRSMPDLLEKEYGIEHPCRADFAFDIPNPEIWWPNGLGDQPLYNVHVELSADKDGFDSIDVRNYPLGLRTLTVSNEPDEYGREFCFVVNGHKIFAMGGDYIPQDNLLPYATAARDEKLLMQMHQSNFNCIRVWGGGYYPSEEFYRACDRLGLIVWQDFMFACAIYRMTDSFRKNVTMEVIDNVKRMRNHCCLGILCGNNEMESAWAGWGIPKTEELREDYLALFEELIPTLCKLYAPDTFYWPSSPSTTGNFNNPDDPNSGDTHYWDVWHGKKPKEEFKKYHFRFLSEYGFVSIPNMHTVRAFATQEDLHLDSEVMELHHRCEQGREKLLYYMEAETGIPESFEKQVYATQMNQADAIRANVEHMRRSRGRCMGSVYWQINDSNPAISWAGLDYYGRYKALQYYAKDFHAPVLLSMDVDDRHGLEVYITNDTLKSEEIRANIYLMDARDITALSGKWDHTKLIGSITAMAEPLSAKCIYKADLAADFAGDGVKYKFLRCELYIGGRMILERNQLLTAMKNFGFVKPHPSVVVLPEMNTMTAEQQTRAEESGKCTSFIVRISSDTFMKGICLDLKEYKNGEGEKTEPFFTENWFDLTAGQSKDVILRLNGAEMSPEEVKAGLEIMSVYDILH